MQEYNKAAAVTCPFPQAKLSRRQKIAGQFAARKQIACHERRTTMCYHAKVHLFIGVIGGADLFFEKGSIGRP